MPLLDQPGQLAQHRLPAHQPQHVGRGVVQPPGGAPERVYQWTPNVSGMATIQTCGAGTNFDTVLYIRNSPCATGSELPGGCNDDACTNSTGLVRASRLTPTVTAGQTYFIIVDGYSTSSGSFTLSVTPSGA